MVGWLGRGLIAGIGMAIAVIATWRPRSPSPESIGHRLALNLPSWVLLALLIASLAMFLAVMSTLIPAPRRKDPEEPEFEPPPPPKLSPMTMVLLLFLIGAGIVGAFFAVRALVPGQPGADAGVRSSASGLERRASPPEPPRETVHASAADWSFTLTLSVLAAAAICFSFLVIAANDPWTLIREWFRRRTRRKWPMAQELTAVVAVGLRDFETADDPRLAVIACYRRCEAAIATHRRRRYAAETPREFVAEALGALRLPRPAVRALLAAFEHARFSELPVTPHDREVALGALSDIRSALDQGEHHGRR